MRGLITLVLLLGLIFLAYAGQQDHLYYLELNNTNHDVYKNITDKIIWNYTNPYEDGNITADHKNRFDRILYKTIDWLGYTIIELGKWSLEFGYNHPEYDFKAFSELINIFLCVLIIATILSATPALVPIIALLYLLLVGIKKSFLWVSKRIMYKPLKNSSNTKPK